MIFNKSTICLTKINFASNLIIQSVWNSTTINCGCNHALKPSRDSTASTIGCIGSEDSIKAIKAIANEQVHKPIESAQRYSINVAPSLTSPTFAIITNQISRNYHWNGLFRSVCYNEPANKHFQQLGSCSKVERRTFCTSIKSAQAKKTSATKATTSSRKMVSEVKPNYIYFISIDFNLVGWEFKELFLFIVILFMKRNKTVYQFFCQW